MTMTGTSSGVVFACIFDITVNHYQDIHVKSSNGDYNEVTLRITSNNSEDYSIEAKHNGGTTTTAEICVFPLADETITPTTVDPNYTGAEYEHTATEGWRFGGEDGNVESSNVVVDGKIGIATTTPNFHLDVNGDVNVTETLMVDRPSDAWASDDTWITVGSGSGNKYGTINTGGSYATTINGNGYRKGSAQWQSFGAGPSGGEYYGATQIWQFPAGYMTFNANSTWTTGSSSVVTERMRIFGNGDVSIGTTSSGYKLRVAGNTYIEDQLTIGDVGSEGGEIRLLDANNDTIQAAYLDIDAANNARFFQIGNGHMKLGNLLGGLGETQIYCNGELKIQVKSTQVEISDHLWVTSGDGITTTHGIECGGSMSVDSTLEVTSLISGDSGLEISGTKNFRIAHPIRDGHDLIHTCVESPQADLTYRGTATLVDGTVQVDLDSEFGMTAGTFAVLNDDVQVFAQNDSGWDAVRGSVIAGVLTINCQNLESTDSVGWLVIGRRTDVKIEIEPKTKIK